MAKKYVVYNGPSAFTTTEEFMASPWFVMFSSIVNADDHSDLGLTVDGEQINNRWVGIVTAKNEEDLSYFNEHTLVSHASEVAEVLSESLVPNQQYRGEEEKLEWINSL